MKKHLKTFLFAALTCSLLLGAGISAEAASKIRIDDTNFAWAVKEYAVEADTNDDGYLSKKEAAKIKEVHFASSLNIDSLKGLEYFKDIREFSYRADYASTDYEDRNIYENSTVSAIDLKGFKQLKEVTVKSSNPYLKSVALKNCPALEKVTIEGWKEEDTIDHVILDGCRNLRTVSCWWTNEDKLNLANCKKLTDVTIVGYQLKKCNLKKCSALRSLWLSSDALTTVKLKGTTKLESATILGPVQTLDLKSNKNLKELKCTSAGLTALDLRDCCDLTTLDIRDSKITSLDLKNNKKLKKIDLRSNKNLSVLNVKGCRKLKELRIDRSPLTKLNVKKNHDLKKLICEGANLTKLNLKNNKKLRLLKCSDNNIRSLNLTNTKIKDVSGLECDKDVAVTFAR